MSTKITIDGLIRVCTTQAFDHGTRIQKRCLIIWFIIQMDYKWPKASAGVRCSTYFNIYIYMIYTLVHLDIRSSFDAFFDGFPIFSIVLSSSWLTIWATAICFSMIVDVWIISCPVLKHWIIWWFVGQPQRKLDDMVELSNMRKGDISEMSSWN